MFITNKTRFFFHTKQYVYGTTMTVNSSLYLILCQQT